MQVRTAFSVRPLLHKFAEEIGKQYGVTLGVAHTPDGLFFINDTGEIVRDGPVHIICCNDEECASGDFLKFFVARVHYAALCQAFAQEYVRQKLGGVN